MSKNNSNLKNNLIRLAIFLSVALLSAFLLMAAINMLNLPKAGTGGGGTNKSSSSDKNDKQPKSTSKSGGNNYERNDDWRDRVKKRRSERKSPEPFDGGFSMGEGQQGGGHGNGEYTLPENVPNIDISGGNTIPDIPFGSGSNGESIVLTDEKQPHEPVFEVLGYPNYPFLKVMVMENYYNNRWFAVNEEPEVVINFDEYLDEKYSDNSVKIKPIVPSNGFLPVLSGNIDFKYRTSVNRYNIAETYYSESTISDFYSMDYDRPVGLDRLIFANTDDSYPYSVSIPEYIEKLVDDIIEECNSDYEIIKSVESYLLKNYHLKNDVKNNYGQNDGIISFLMNRGGVGNTLDFMSAYAYLLRAAGIPCRLAVGYKINPEVPYQIVYRDQTYIYPEIKFELYGWIPMDVFGYDTSYVPPIETITQITSVSPEAKRGTNFTVTGTVTDFSGKALDGMSVLIYVKPSKTENTLSYAKAEVFGGKFEVTCDIKHSTGAGKYQVVADLLENDLYRTSTSDPEMRVTTDTQILIDSIDTVVGKSFKIEGRLIDSYTLEGIPAQKLDITYLGEDVDDSVLSGEEGKFSKIVELKKFEKLPANRDFFFVKGYNISYNVEFMGTDIFYPSSNTGKIFVWYIIWMRIVLALLLIVVIIVSIAVFGIFKRRKLEKEDLILALDCGLSSPATFVPEYVQDISRNKDTRIFINFPQIKEGYPDVWGINEEITVCFEDGFKNRDEMKMVFDRKGTYGIKVLEGSDELSKRNIRIVDYREEVIACGKLLLKEFSESADINNKMTLREILLLMKPRLTTMKYMILEQIFSIMEKAVYSLSAIKREDYELFYMCINKFKSVE